MSFCKSCSSVALVKTGFVANKQRFKCKKCGMLQISGDKRIKYDKEIKIMAMILYKECNGFRRIARILSKIFQRKISYQLIQYWFKNAYIKMKDELENIPKIKEDIDILEMDELYTFIKKKTIKSEYGLLFLEGKWQLLHIQ